MPKPKVYITQEPMRKNEAREWVPKGLDFSSATDFGELVMIWPPGKSIYVRSLLQRDADAVAAVYDPEQDYVLCLGSPTLIAILAHALGRAGKRLRLLEWDHADRRYYPSLIETMEEEG